MNNLGLIYGDSVLKDVFGKCIFDNLTAHLNLELF